MQLWIPYIIFKNTDADEAVKVDYDKSEIETDISVSRESDFTRSGPEMADEVRDSLIILFETVIFFRSSYSTERIIF